MYVFKGSLQPNNMFYHKYSQYMLNNRYTDGKYRYFITTHIMDLPRCHRQYLISPVLFVGALIP